MAFFENELNSLYTVFSFFFLKNFLIDFNNIDGFEVRRHNVS